MRLVRRCHLCNGPLYPLIQLDGSKDWVHVFEDMRHSAVVRRWWQR